MKTGFSKKVITPKVGVPLAGFGVVRIANQILDDLYVKVIVCEVHDKIFGFISFDLLAIDHLIIDAIKMRIKDKGYESSNFVIMATHTHSGPQGIVDTSQGFLKSAVGILGDSDATLIEMIVAQTLDAFDESVQTMKDSKVRFVKDTLQGVGTNRSDQSLAGDDDIVAIEFIQDRKDCALITLFACHPTVLSLDSLAISGDFVSAYEKHMKKQYKVNMFLNGSCGDISTRFTREGTGYDEAMRFGSILANKVKDMITYNHEVDIKRMNIYSYHISLQTKQADSIAVAMGKIEECTRNVEAARGMGRPKERFLESLREGAVANYHYALHYDGKDKIDVNIDILEINDELFVCIPGELFSELSNELKDGSTHFISFANGYLMYFANEYAYDHQYYESYSSPFKRGESEKMMAFIHEKMNAIRSRYI